MRLSIAASLVLLAPVFVGVAADASAQSQKPRLAGIAPAPQPVSAAGRYHRGGRGRHGARAVYRVPVRIAANGQVFANFGFGYEPVLRSCGAQYSAPINYAPPVYSAPTYTVPTYSPPTYGQHPNTQPAPAQLTESQKMARAAAGVTTQPKRNQHASGSVGNHTAACWAANSQGGITVYQP